MKWFTPDKAGSHVIKVSRYNVTINVKHYCKYKAVGGRIEDIQISVTTLGFPLMTSANT